MFRGSAQATVDDRGRLKIPSDFRRVLEENWGSDVFITSPFGDAALIYPLQEWEQVEKRLLALPSTDEARNRYLEWVNYFGLQGRLDASGRVLIPGNLRESAGMSGEVVVAGRINYLEVWNRERLAARLEAARLTAGDLKTLTERGF